MSEQEHQVKKFLSKDDVYKEFEKMIQEVGKSAHISPALTRKYVKEALREWENESKLDVLKLMGQNEKTQREQVPEMIQAIQPKIEEILEREAAIGEVLEDIAQAFKKIYDLE